jgi:hypothetical protein
VPGAPPPASPSWPPGQSAAPPGSPPPGWLPAGPAVGYPGGYGPPPPAERPLNSLAVVGFVLSLVCPSPISAGVSIAGLVSARRTGERGRGLAIAGLVISAVLVLLVVVGVVLVASAGAERDASGRVTEAGSVSLDSLRTGDCIPKEPGTVVRSVDVIPCSTTHWGQVLATYELRAGSYPGDDEIEQLAVRGCVDRFSPDVIERIRDHELGLYYFLPQRRSWTSDRGVSCVVYAHDGRLSEVLPTS